MFMRVGMSLAAALAAASIATAMIKPAHVEPRWTYNNMTGAPLTLADTTQLPPDGQSTYSTPFASYMYGSVINPPRVAAVRLSALTATLAFAPLTTDAHAAWCKARFRSYNEATDTFTGFDGLRHRCASPY